VTLASRKPKLTFIVDHLNLALAGTENQLFKMFPGLVDHFQVEVICFRYEGDWLETQGKRIGFSVKHFEIRDFKRALAYRNLWRLRAHLKASAPDVVHTFFPVSNIVGVLAAKLAGVPAIVASRRDFGEWMSGRYLTATKIANRAADWIVTNSTQVKKLTERVESYPADRIEVIFNGIDLSGMKIPPVRDEMRRELGIPAGDTVCVLVGNYRPMKRHQTLVEAAALILERRPEVSFLLVGGDYTPGEPLKSAVKKRAAELGIESKIFYAHAKGDVQKFLAAADIGVNYSQGEGISNAIMEYMTARLPCVIAASGGNPDLVEHEVTGLLFELDNPRSMADNVERMIADKGLQERVTARAYENVSTRMTIPGMIDHFRKFYTQIVPRKADDSDEEAAAA
jgi:glycosyltransferase involved in cell wall biosynthesis